MNECIRNFDKAARTYLTELTALGMSEQTIVNYSNRIKRFRDFWTATEPDEDPTPEAVRNYRDNLMGQGLSKATVKQYLVELKAFFEFACDVDFAFFEKNPVSKRMYPKITNADDKIYDKILTVDDLKKLWVNERPNTNMGHKRWARNYAIITLLLDGKIRNSELLDLKLSDIDFEYNEIEIERGKGGKRRLVTVSDISISAIKLYLASGARPDYVADDDYLFGTTAEKGNFGGKTTSETANWHKGTNQWLSSLVERHVATVTGKHGFRTHSLRHNGAMIDLNNGASLERIQAELGHSSKTTTEIYTGRLQSVRKERGYKEVVAVRDQIARENLEMLEAM